MSFPFLGVGAGAVFVGRDSSGTLRILPGQCLNPYIAVIAENVASSGALNSNLGHSTTWDFGSGPVQAWNVRSSLGQFIVPEIAVAAAMGLQAPDPESLWYVKLRKKETSAVHAAAFDDLVLRDATTGVDLMWSLSYYEAAKHVANRAINELRGVAEIVGEGFPCGKCGSRLTFARTVQLAAGDEPSQLEIRCLAPGCRNSQIVG